MRHCVVQCGAMKGSQLRIKVCVSILPSTFLLREGLPSRFGLRSDICCAHTATPERRLNMDR
jgi:hypothetical protein